MPMGGNRKETPRLRREPAVADAVADRMNPFTLSGAHCRNAEGESYDAAPSHDTAETSQDRRGRPRLVMPGDRCEARAPQRVFHGAGQSLSCHRRTLQGQGR